VTCFEERLGIIHLAMWGDVGYSAGKENGGENERYYSFTCVADNVRRCCQGKHIPDANNGSVHTVGPERKDKR
jgi:hypothetical protein